MLQSHTIFERENSIKLTNNRNHFFQRINIRFAGDPGESFRRPPAQTARKQEQFGRGGEIQEATASVGKRAEQSEGVVGAQLEGRMNLNHSQQPVSDWIQIKS